MSDTMVQCLEEQISELYCTVARLNVDKDRLVHENCRLHKRVAELEKCSCPQTDAPKINSAEQQIIDLLTEIRNTLQHHG